MRRQFNKTLSTFIRRYDKNIHPMRVDEVSSKVTSILVIIALLFMTTLVGIVGFIVLEGFTFIDALYMTLITMSTVGFGEVRELSQVGRLFVSFLILTNIGIFAYAIGQLASFVVEGQFRKVINNIIIGRKIDRMKNHVIVCGYGRYGKNVVERLINQDQKVVLVEADDGKFESLKRKPGVLFLDGDATDEASLKEAGVEHASALISTLPVDADNVYVILSARQLNPNLKIISRANVASSKKKMKHAGANHVLVPENIGGFYMSSLVTKPDIINIFNEISGMDKTGFKMVEIILDPLPDRLVGKTLGDLQIVENTGVSIIGIKLPSNLQVSVNPSRTMSLIEGMAIIVLGNSEQIELFHQHSSEFVFIE